MSRETFEARATRARRTFGLQRSRSHDSLWSVCSQFATSIFVGGEFESPGAQPTNEGRIVYTVAHLGGHFLIAPRWGSKSFHAVHANSISEHLGEVQNNQFEEGLNRRLKEETMRVE